MELTSTEEYWRKFCMQRNIVVYLDNYYNQFYHSYNKQVQKKKDTL